MLAVSCSSIYTLLFLCICMCIIYSVYCGEDEAGCVRMKLAASWDTILLLGNSMQSSNYCASVSTVYSDSLLNSCTVKHY